jgi:hypothetical protein
MLRTLRFASGSVAMSPGRAVRRRILALALKAGAELHIPLRTSANEK